MSTAWKLLIALGLVLPTGAFVAGALTASSVDRSVPRDSVVIQERQPGPDDSHPSPTPPARQSSTTAPSPAPAADRVASSEDGDHRDDHGPRSVSTGPDDPGDDGGDANEAGAAEDQDQDDPGQQGQQGDEADEDEGNVPAADNDHSGPGGGDDADESNEDHGGHDDHEDDGLSTPGDESVPGTDAVA
jgi:hypothetical protein